MHVTVYHCVTSVYKENRDLLKSKKQTQKEREKEYNTLKKQDIQDVFIKTNLTKPVFSMIWLV